MDTDKLFFYCTGYFQMPKCILYKIFLTCIPVERVHNIQHLNIGGSKQLQHISTYFFFQQILLLFDVIEK